MEESTKMRRLVCQKKLPAMRQRSASNITGINITGINRPFVNSARAKKFTRLAEKLRGNAAQYESIARALKKGRNKADAAVFEKMAANNRQKTVEALLIAQASRPAASIAMRAIKKTVRRIVSIMRRGMQ